VTLVRRMTKKGGVLANKKTLCVPESGRLVSRSLYGRIHDDQVTNLA
jgi:hypothetical protein